jgi:hypothetical protein
MPKQTLIKIMKKVKEEDIFLSTILAYAKALIKQEVIIMCRKGEERTEEVVMIKTREISDRKKVDLLAREIKKGITQGFRKLEKQGKLPADAEERFRLAEEAVEEAYDFYSLSYCRLLKRKEV